MYQLNDSKGNYPSKTQKHTPRIIRSNTSERLGVAAITAKDSAIEFRLSKPAFRPVALRVSQLLSRQRPLRSKFDPRPVTKLIKTDGQN